MLRRQSSKSAENVSRASGAPPPPDILSDLQGEDNTEAVTDVQSCIDFIDCLLRAPDMVEIPRGGETATRPSRGRQESVESIAVKLPLKQQRETLLC